MKEAKVAKVAEVVNQMKPITSIPLDKLCRLDVMCIAPHSMVDGHIKALFVAGQMWLSPNSKIYKFFLICPIDKFGDVDRCNILINVQSKSEDDFEAVDQLIQLNFDIINTLLVSFVDLFEVEYPDMSI